MNEGNPDIKLSFLIKSGVFKPLEGLRMKVLFQHQRIDLFPKHQKQQQDKGIFLFLYVIFYLILYLL